METINYIDLCCGIGGFRVALNRFQQQSDGKYQFNCVLSADIKTDALKTYNLNFNEKNPKLNIFDINEIPPFDLLCAGFPCQPFSTAGNKKGFNDDRGGIIFKIIDICKTYQPKTVILENVSNLITLEGGRPLQRICDEFQQIGYGVSYKKLSSCDFGVPQNRERVFIVCSLNQAVDLEKIEVMRPMVTLASVIDTEAKYTDIEPRFASKMLEIHSETPIYGYKMQDKRGGGNNIHSWDIGVNGQISNDERQLMNTIMTERRKKHWAEKRASRGWTGCPSLQKKYAPFMIVPIFKRCWIIWLTKSI
jgi:DNA (cytosine-5)-methyltransferase 1